MARYGVAGGGAGCVAAKDSGASGEPLASFRVNGARGERGAMAESVGRSPVRPMSVARHPIQAMILPVPIVCFIGALVTDLAYYCSGGNLLWLNFSSWLITTGLVFGAVALVVQLVDLIRSTPDSAALPAEPILIRRTAKPPVMLRVLPIDGAARNVFRGSKKKRRSPITQGRRNTGVDQRQCSGLHPSRH